MVEMKRQQNLGERKLKISDVAKDTNINRGTITRLYHENFTRIEKDVLDTLCPYFNCRIEDLIEYVPNEPKKPDEG